MVAGAVGGALLGSALGGTPYAVAGGLTVGSAGAWAGLWLTLVRARGWGWRELGFVRPRRSAWHLGWQVPVALAAGLIGAAGLGAALGLTPGSDPTAGDLRDAAPAGPLVLALLTACTVLVLPAAEEVLFRRVLLDWLVTRVPAVVAVPGAACAFAAAHVVPVVMVYVVFLGLSAGLLRRWYDSLWPPLVLHAVNNAIVVLVVVASLPG